MNSYCQTHFNLIDINAPTNESENIPYKIKSISLKTPNQLKLGAVASLRDETVYPLELKSNIEKSMFAFVSKRFVSVQEKPLIEMEIRTMRIAPAKSGSFSPTDTFLFECNFIFDKDVLYQFKARNSFGLFNEPDKIMNNYLTRALVSAIKQFTKSYNKNPEWSKGNTNPLFNVKAKVIHNDLKKDENLISCDANHVLSFNDFNGKLPNDSISNDVISKLILTYKAESEETSKGIELMINTKAYFDKNRSWKKTSISNTNWLQYQQGHFDICSIYGQKLKDTLSSYSYSIGEFKSELNQVYNAVYSEYVSFRKQYAEETNNGTNSEKMTEWRNKLSLMMKKGKN